MAQDRRFRRRTTRFRLWQHIEPFQHTGGVRADLQTGADLREALGPLADGDLPARPRQCQGGRGAEGFEFAGVGVQVGDLIGLLRDFGGEARVLDRPLAENLRMSVGV